MKLRRSALVGVVALLTTPLLSSGHASAATTSEWHATDYTTVIDSTHVEMAIPAGAPADSVASLYSLDLNMHVEAGTWVNFFMDTQGETWCWGNYPQVSVTVDGRVFSSFDDETPCPAGYPGQGNTQDDGLVWFEIKESGTLTEIHLKYQDADEVTDSPGDVILRDLWIGDQQIKWAEDPAPPPQCQGSNCPHVTTAYGATLSKNMRTCRVKTYAFLDQALAGQWADPQKRTFVTRVDGRVRSRLTVQAGHDARDRLHVRPHSGKRTVTVKTRDGQLLDRIRVRTGRC